MNDIELIRESIEDASIEITAISTKRRPTSKVSSRGLYIEQGLHEEGSDLNSSIYIHESNLKDVIFVLQKAQEIFQSEKLNEQV